MLEITIFLTAHWDPGRRTNFEHFEIDVFKVFKVPPPANVPGLNFENFENDGVTTIFKVFKVFKVLSLGQLAGTGRRNFENSENGGATTIFRVFRGVTGPRPAPVTTKNGERPVLILGVKVNHAVGGGPKRGQNKNWRASCAHFSEVKVSHAVGGGPKKSHG